MPIFENKHLGAVLLVAFLVSCGSSGDNDGTDSDGDGVIDSLDAFPNDATETLDTDGDGIGDNSDTDRDGDGVDNDSDVFPDDATETIDSDGDGVGDNSDADRDGDGVDNDSDAFPDDATETVDTDGDGIGNNTDTDDDNDSIEDIDDVDADNDGLIELTTLEHLDWVRNDLAGTSLTDFLGNSDSTGCPTEGCAGYELMADLDFDTNGDGAMDIDDTYYDYDGDGSANGWLPIGNNASRFSASFDGNGFSISNLYINRPSSDAETSGSYIGLFGYVRTESNKSTILSNINLDGALMAVTGYQRTGGLIGLISSDGTQTVSNNTVTGDVTGNNLYAGGLIGYASGSSSGTQTISHNISSGDVSGYRYTGGLIGDAYNEIGNPLTLSNNVATGDVSGSNNHTGGLVGLAVNTGFNNNMATGDVTGDGDYTGGLIGLARNDGTTMVISKNIASSAVSGTDAGAFIGDTAGNVAAITYIANYYNRSEAGANTLPIVGNGTEPEVGEVEGYTLTELQCPVTSDDIDNCVSGSTLYDGWSTLDWDFGTSTELPGLVIDDVIYRDANGDGNLTVTDIVE